MASQHHRPDLGEGIVLFFRHGESPYRTVEVSLKGLDPGATYAIESMTTGVRIRARGADLMGRFPLTLDEPRKAELLRYERVLE